MRWMGGGVDGRWNGMGGGRRRVDGTIDDHDDGDNVDIHTPKAGLHDLPWQAAYLFVSRG